MAPRSSTSYRDSLPPDEDRRRSSVASNPNVFSDDYAIPSPPNSLDDDDPLDQIRVSDSSSTPRWSLRNPVSVARYPSIPNRQSDAGSTTKRHLLIDDQPLTMPGGLDRSLSTSSRVSIPRTPSPYNGPTAPSRPYAMYPQVTRASSIASQSTVRPHQETPFVPRGGPEHPYSLYPQNVVSEEDEDITANGIPLGFPSGLHFQSQAGPSNSEVGDIVGTDGHVEQLPPYTRYADNTVAKGDMNEINGARRSQIRRRSSLLETPAPLASTLTEEDQPLNPPDEDAAERDRPQTRADALRMKLHHRVCGGIPLWAVLFIGTGIMMAAVVGGVVGGVIGNRQGAQRAFALGATTTIWLDALPTTTGAGSPGLPTGQFEIPLNQTQEIKSCIAQSWLVPAWGCMDIAFLGINVSQSSSGVMQATFEDFSTNTKNFRYGPQPPDFNCTSFDLRPFHDKDDSNYGVAMFFSAYFDKLSIIPENAIQPPGPGPANPINVRNVAARAAPYDGAPLRPSDQPWFCFWNSTVNEFFVYVSQAAPTSPTSVPDAYPGAHMTTTSMPVGNTVIAQQITAVPVITQPTTVFQAFNPTPPTTTQGNFKRSYESENPNVSNYPRLVKMVEKRMPSGNIPPYCQKMQVLDDYQIEPIMTAPTIQIDEIEFATAIATESAAAYSQNNKREIATQLDQRDIPTQIDFESNCICEWLSY